MPASVPTLLDPGQILRQRFAAAAQRAFPGVDLPDPIITLSQSPKFGDYQCNSAMPYSKLLSKPPRQVAEALVAAVDIADIAEPLTPASIAGPGFINITLSHTAVATLLAQLDTPDLGLPIDPDAPVTVVDLCGVNLAKQMHIGHLRSTVIGDTLARVLERTIGPAKVKRQNHVGDWGLPIAMVTARLIDLENAQQIDLAKLTLDDLDAIYKQAKQQCQADEEGLQTARAWGMGPKIEAELEAANAEPLAHLARAKSTLVALQSGDPDVRRVWKRIFDTTMAACLATCARLNASITEAHTAGESSYENKLAPLVARLEQTGVAELGSGALIIKLDDMGIPEPCLIRKSDGGYLYATTDLAAIMHRTSSVATGGLGALRVVYCVDARQSLHFRQVFAAARKAGLVAPTLSLEHAAFGTILGEDNKPFKSRSGDSVKLGDVIDEVVAAALSQLRARPRAQEMTEAEMAHIAQGVALAAIRYTDLSTERIKDYVFSIARMVSFEGQTGPYLLYALARVCSILRNAQGQGLLIDAQVSGPITVTHPAEKALALVLLRYPQVVRDVDRTLEPSRLCALLYELAGAFARFFEACPVLKAEDDGTRTARLRLCQLTRRVLTDGLGLLGIPAIERM